MKKKPGRPRHSPELQAEISENIIEIAMDLFTNQGYEHVSMRKIAERAGCAPPTLYHYFANKRALLQHIWTRLFDDSAKYLQERLKLSTDPKENIRNTLDIYIDYWMKHQDNYRVIFQIEDLTAKPDQDYDINDSQGLTEVFGSLEREVSKCVDSGVFRAEDPELIFQTLIGGAMGLANSLITTREFPWRESDAIIKIWLDSMIGGLEART